MTRGQKTDSKPASAKKTNGRTEPSAEAIGLTFVRRVVRGFDLKKINDGNIALLWGVADAVFAWEKQVMILGEPSAEERKQHKETIYLFLKLVKPLAKFSGDKRLEMLQTRLEDSVGMFYGMSEEEADKALSVFE